MAGYDDESMLRTLADAVSNPPGSDSGGGELAASVEVEAVKVLSGEDEVEAAKVLSGVGPEVEVEDGGLRSGYGFSVGDLVWGKIKSHPWWPGQIYDPQQASELALKFNRKGRLLVAYFGDGSFAWCLPSQLVHFAEHFEDMSSQSSSKIFTSAVQEAVDEVGRLVEMEMVCKCVGEEARKGMEAPVADNAGIQGGVRVPRGELGKQLALRYCSGEFMASVRGFAAGVSHPKALELGILKGFLSGFNRSRGGGYPLAVCYEGIMVEGLEDQNKSVVSLKKDAVESIEAAPGGPQEEDWSATVSSFKRKQKSVAEIMGEGSEVDVKHGRKKKNVDASATGGKRDRKLIGETETAGEEAAPQKVLTIQVQDSEAGENPAEGVKLSEELSSPRERKKSKYLSPPYTNPQGVPKVVKEGLEQESPRIPKSPGVGESMTRAAGILLQPPPVGGQTGLENFPPKVKETPVPVKKIEASDVNASPREVLEGVVSVAGRPKNLWDETTVSMIRGFVTTFRSCSYREGAHYKTFNQSKSGQKRKSAKENGDAKSSEDKPKKVAKRSVVKLNEKKVQGNAVAGNGHSIVERRPLQQLDSVRQRLEVLASMVEKCDGKISEEEAANLETETLMLFDKVRKMNEDV